MGYPAVGIFTSAGRWDAKPGQSLEPLSLPPLDRWWPELPGQTAEPDPIVSSRVVEAGK
jgi:hypothetical protein